MTGYLSHDELIELTGYVQPRAQVRELQALGIAHLVRSNGRPVVAWADARPWDNQVKMTEEPNYAALRRGT